MIRRIKADPTFEGIDIIGATSPRPRVPRPAHRRGVDAVKVGVNAGVPVKYSWLCTFAIMTDVIWIYLEILKILSYFMRRD